MIYCLSLNPAMDKTVKLADFTFDSPNRVTVQRTDVGGKALNCARVLKALGLPVHVVGFDFNGVPVRIMLDANKIPATLVETGGDLRVNLKLQEMHAGRTIEINEQGVRVTGEMLSFVEQTLLKLVKPGDWVLLSGSIPPGCKATLYRDFCTHLHEKGALVAVDADGEVLKLAVEAKPDLIKPNAQEFRTLTGEWATLENAAAVCRQLHKRGVGLVCVTLGRDGAMLSSAEEAVYCPAPRVAVQSVHGAGDSMLSGIISALARKKTLSEALLIGSAAAGASIRLEGTQMCTLEDFKDVLLRYQDPPRKYETEEQG